MICTMGGGNLDDVGRIINKVPPSKDGCYPDDNRVGKTFTTILVEVELLVKGVAQGRLQGDDSDSVYVYYSN